MPYMYPHHAKKFFSVSYPNQSSINQRTYISIDTQKNNGKKITWPMDKLWSTYPGIPTLLASY